MQEIDVSVECLLGYDPVVGREALEELRQGQPRLWPEIFETALKAPRSIHGVDRLARLCGYFGADAAHFLVSQIENGSWEAKNLAASCFRYIRHADVVAEVAHLLERSQYFDVQRLAMTALGEAGADGWSYLIIEVTLGPQEPFQHPNSYVFEKLGAYAAEALATMVVRELEESDVYSDLASLRMFLERVWEYDKVKKLHPGTDELKQYVLGGLRTISPIGATPLQEKWLHNNWTFLQLIAAEALQALPMDRVAGELGRTLLDKHNDSQVRYLCAMALMNFATPQASRCLKPALELIDQSEPLVRRAILSAWSGLFFYDSAAQLGPDLLAAIPESSSESRGQLSYGLALRGERPDLIEEALSDSNAYTRAAAALGLARLGGANAIPRLRNLRRDAATSVERLFTSAALVHAGDAAVRNTLHSDLCQLPPEFRAVHLLRPIWKREILAALNSEAPPWTREAIAWAEVMEMDVDRCMEQIGEIRALAPQAHKPFRPKAQNGKAAGPPPEKKHGPMIFISYSHVDEKWRKRLEMVLSPLTRVQALDLWSDTKIDPGTRWKQEIQEALERADAAILLVTQAFLASDFIVTNELPRLLERAKDRGIPILWIPVSNSMYTNTEIANYQAVIDPKRPLDTFRGAQLNTKLVEIATAISRALQKPQKAEA